MKKFLSVFPGLILVGLVACTGSGGTGGIACYTSTLDSSVVGFFDHSATISGSNATSTGRGCGVRYSVEGTGGLTSYTGQITANFNPNCTVFGGQSCVPTQARYQVAGTATFYREVLGYTITLTQQVTLPPTFGGFNSGFGSLEVISPANAIGLAVVWQEVERVP